MRSFVLPALLLATTSGCILVSDDGGGGYDPGPQPDPDPVVYNYAPELIDGEAGCYWDGYYRDNIWYFEADVDDPDGIYDVTSVYADVYDDYNGQLVESFELYPTDDAYYWYSDWLEQSTYLDCYYTGFSVDLVVYDSYDDSDWITVYPYQN